MRPIQRTQASLLQVVLERQPPTSSPATDAPTWSLKFVMLNPASHFLKVPSCSPHTTNATLK